ncbi:zinc finger protein 28 homolog isoform X4 [Nilaparvata lugens]|uniref:zinc finger protein 28 homolog isoform X4 n=1 Tax=Nilaparvata lugens TaxID=108931 RepID=UPI00193D354A|nr:zinc finger protein 28 homolog isoform X4 [Nilaparvata lugens]
MDCAIRGIHTLGLQIPLIKKEYPDDTPKESDTNQAEKENRDVDDDDYLKNDADDENAMMDFVKDEIEIDEKPVSMEDFSSNIPAKSVIPKADEGNACFVDDNGNDAHDKNDNDSENEEKPTIKTEIEIDEKPLIKNFFRNSAVHPVIPKSEPLDSSIASESLRVGLASHNYMEFDICGRIAFVCLHRLEDEEPNFIVGNLNLGLKREFLLDDNNYEIGSTSKTESSSSHDDSPDDIVEERPSLASLREFRMKRARQRSREQDSISDDDSDTMQTYKCSKCKFVAQTRKQLQTHSKIHNGKELICEICQYAASDRVSFEKHYRIHTGEKPFECEICDHKFTQKQHLERHYRAHTGEKPYACTICDSKFSNSDSLKEHNMRIHIGKKCKGNDRKIFSCKICHSTFSQRYRLRRHEKTHTVGPRDRNFHCTECTYRSFTAVNLSKHIRIHTGKKPFSCSECSYKTCSSSDLSKHKKIHSGVKPFCCDICGYRSIRLNHLKQHIRTHTGEKPYSCKECRQEFTSSTHLNYHRKTKHGANDTGSNPESYKCGKCRFVGGTKQLLEKHSMIHNGKERFC